MLTLPIDEQNKIIAELPVIKELKEELGGLKDGQDEIFTRLGRGDTRMGKIEKDLGELKEDQKNSFIEVIRLFSDLKSTIKDEQLRDLKDELKTRKEHSFTWVHALTLLGFSGLIAMVLKLIIP